MRHTNKDVLMALEQRPPGHPAWYSLARSHHVRLYKSLHERSIVLFLVSGAMVADPLVTSRVGGPKVFEGCIRASRAIVILLAERVAFV